MNKDPSSTASPEDQAPPSEQELSDAELNAVVGGAGTLVHEQVHAGTGGAAPKQPTSTNPRPPRTPPSWPP